MTVTGQVVNLGTLPVAGANVFVSDSSGNSIGAGTISDSLGMFTLDAGSASYITASHIQHGSKVTQAVQPYMKFELDPSPYELPGVTVGPKPTSWAPLVLIGSALVLLAFFGKK